MNETRKQIIELIEPYMDKSLWTWCYIEIENWYPYWEITKEIFKIWNESVSNNRVDNYPIYDWACNISKIIWHYSITSVLKYIADKWKDVLRVKIWVNEIEYQIWEAKIYELNTDSKVQNYASCSYYYIENKPLHLFSDTEEKELLELLLKLK